MTLGRKLRTTEQEWATAVGEAYAHPDTMRAAALVEGAAHRLQRTMAALHVTGAVVAWSGGKDSQAVHIVAEAAGLADHCALVITRGLEYPEAVRWLALNAPPGLLIVDRPHDLAWLARHQGWVFPSTSAQSARWYAAVQHAGQRQAMRMFGAPVMVMGRRLADGNHCGPQGVYRDREGFWRVSPLWDWSHEDVLCVLGAYGAHLAPWYRWPRGFQVGTGPWAKRRRHPDGMAATWAVVASIDRSVVAAAARAGIVGANLALARQEAPA